MTQHLDDDCEFGGSAHIHDVKKKFVKSSFHENHAYDLCLRRDAKCPCCEVKDTIIGDIHYTYVTTDYHHKCPDWPAQCPNSCKPYLSLTQLTVGTHVEEECPETLVDCKLAEVGCMERRKRKDMPGHVKDAWSDRVTAMFEDHMKLKRENEELKRAL